MSVTNQYSLVQFRKKRLNKQKVPLMLYISHLNLKKMCFGFLYVFTCVCVWGGALHDYCIRLQIGQELIHLYIKISTCSICLCQNLQNWIEWCSFREIQRRQIRMQHLHAAIKKLHPSSPSLWTASTSRNILWWYCASCRVLITSQHLAMQSTVAKDIHDKHEQNVHIMTLRNGTFICNHLETG